MPSASASSAPDSAHSSNSWYQSAPERARRDISMPSTSPTCPRVISVTSRWKPTRPTALDPDLPRSSSITSTREVGQPNPTARSTSPYCSRVDSPWSSTCWRVDWRPSPTAGRSSCRSLTLLPSRCHGNSAVPDVMTASFTGQIPDVDARRAYARQTPRHHPAGQHCRPRDPPPPPPPHPPPLRRGSQPLADPHQPQQPLTSEYRRLPHLVSIHRRILLGGSSRATSRSKVSSAGPTSRSAATGRSAGTGRWSAARSASAGRPSSPTTPADQHRPTHRPPRRPRGGHRRPAIHAEPAFRNSWPVALRAVRAWLTPCSVLARCWRSWSPAAPPRQLQRLLDAVAGGHPLHPSPPPPSTNYRYRALGVGLTARLSRRHVRLCHRRWVWSYVLGPLPGSLGLVPATNV